MIPLVKIMAIFAKTFTKPMIGFIKKSPIHQYPAVKHVFVRIGNQLYRFERKVNRRFLGIENAEAGSVSLSDEKAFENALNFILEVVVLYGIVLGIAFSEVKKNTEEKKKLKNTIEGLEENVAMLKKDSEFQKKKLEVFEQKIMNYENNEDQIIKNLNHIQDNEQKIKTYAERSDEYLVKNNEGIENFRRDTDSNTNKKKSDQF